MSEAPKRGIVFRDPVHQLIHLDDDDVFLLDLIDTKPMQRLRRVKQLGVSWLTYHGAEHSRFSHSMGVLHVASQIFQSLLQRYREFDDIKGILKENQRTVLAAALLHDVGHAPFSHAMERLFPANADHEKQTVALIRNPDLRISKILRENGIEVEDVVSILTKVHSERFLCDIVSSQLDADRMDYLLRDSLFTGVEYGHYDLEWVSNHLCLGREPLSSNSETGDESKLRLCLDRKRGLFAAEQLIIARFHMSMQVYFHAATRKWEAMLLCLLRRAAEIAGVSDNSAMSVLLPDTPRPLREFLEKKGNIEDVVFLKLDDAVLTAAFLGWTESQDSFIAEISSALVNREKRISSDENREIFKSYDLSRKDPVAIGKLLNSLDRDEFHSYQWEHDDIKEWAPYKDFFHKFRGSEGAEHDVNTSSILLSDGNLESDAKPAEVDSFLFRSMGEESVSVSRLFVHHSIAEEIDSLMSKFNLN